jgi:hypothetical protein
LLDRLPPPLRLPFVLGVVTLLATGALAYATGAIDGYLAGERRRRWTGWLTVLAWTASLTGLVLYAGPALAEVSSEGLRLYLANLLTPETAVVPVLLLTCAYTLWKAFRGDAGGRTTQVPSMKHSERSKPPRASRSSARASSTRESTPCLTQRWKRRWQVW